MTTQLLIHNGKLVSYGNKFVVYTGSTPPSPEKTPLTAPSLWDCSGLINLQYGFDDPVEDIDRVLAKINHYSNGSIDKSVYMSYPIVQDPNSYFNFIPLQLMILDAFYTNNSSYDTMQQTTLRPNMMFQDRSSFTSDASGNYDMWYEVPWQYCNEGGFGNTESAAKRDSISPETSYRAISRFIESFNYDEFIPDSLTIQLKLIAKANSQDYSDSEWSEEYSVGAYSVGSSCGWGRADLGLNLSFKDNDTSEFGTSAEYYMYKFNGQDGDGLIQYALDPYVSDGTGFDTYVYLFTIPMPASGAYPWSGTTGQFEIFTVSSLIYAPICSVIGVLDSSAFVPEEYSYGPYMYIAPNGGTGIKFSEQLYGSDKQWFNDMDFDTGLVPWVYPNNYGATTMIIRFTSDSL